MPWERILLVLSLLLNAVLVVAVFFHTAVNEIVVKWLGRRWERRDQERKVLQELYQRMEALSDNYFLSLVMLALSDRASTTWARDDYTRRNQESADKAAEIREFLSRHELEFPSRIRALIENLRKEMLLPKGLESLQDGRVILERSTAVTRVTQEIRTEVVRLINPKP